MNVEEVGVRPDFGKPSHIFGRQRALLHVALTLGIAQVMMLSIHAIYGIQVQVRHGFPFLDLHQQFKA